MTAPTDQEVFDNLVAGLLIVPAAQVSDEVMTRLVMKYRKDMQEATADRSDPSYIKGVIEILDHIHSWPGDFVTRFVGAAESIGEALKKNNAI